MGIWWWYVASIHLCPWNNPFIMSDLCHSKGPGGVIAAWIPVGTSSKPLRLHKNGTICGRTHSTEGANQITKWYILLFHIFFLRCRRAIGCFLKEGYILNKLSYWLLGMIETHGFHYKSWEAPTYQNPHLGTWRCAALRIPLPQSLPEASISGPCVMSNGRLKFL